MRIDNPIPDSPCVGCRRPYRQPPMHVIDGRVYCRSCMSGLVRVLLAGLHVTQQAEVSLRDEAPATIA